MQKIVLCYACTNFIALVNNKKKKKIVRSFVRSAIHLPANSFIQGTRQQAQSVHESRKPVYFTDQYVLLSTN